LNNQFKYKDNGLSEEQIKQRCRFLKIPYIHGAYQENYKWRKMAAFKWWHKNLMDKQDVLLKKAKLKV
jgi:hypothetical protein